MPMWIPGWAHAHVLDPDLGAKKGELVQSLENVGEGPDHQSYLTPQLYLQYYTTMKHMLITQSLEYVGKGSDHGPNIYKETKP
jgi:hypothetical protein